MQVNNEDMMLKRTGRDSMVRFEFDHVIPISCTDFVNNKSRTLKNIDLQTLYEDKENSIKAAGSCMSQSQSRYEPIKAYTKSDKAESRRVSPVHSEDKFKSAENIFIPDVGGDKQMYSKEYVN